MRYFVDKTCLIPTWNPLTIVVVAVKHEAGEGGVEELSSQLDNAALSECSDAVSIPSDPSESRQAFAVAEQNDRPSYHQAPRNETSFTNNAVLTNGKFSLLMSCPEADIDYELKRK